MTQTHIAEVEPLEAIAESVVQSGGSQTVGMAASAVTYSPHTHLHHDEIPISRGEKIATFAAVLLPLAGTIAAMVLLWGTAFSPVYLGIFLVMYLASGLGITVGYHRLFTHRSFDAGPKTKWLWAVLGSMAAEGAVLDWVGMHRRHHQHSDAEGDPHSPHEHGGGVKGILRGFWHSHVGWMFSPDPGNMDRYIVDFKDDAVVQRVSKQFALWFFVGLIIPSVAGGLLTMSWMGVLLGFLWGGAVRVFAVHHATWSINSVCHIWGSRPYNSHDESRNNAIMGVLAMGEGWHNNHHAFPTSARHGLKWWQFDLSYIVIRAMELVGMARRIRVPDKARMEAKRREQAA